MIIYVFECYRVQQKSRDLDIMIGFQVMDGDKYVFVLEGFKDRVIFYVWEIVFVLENLGKVEQFYIQVIYIYFNDYFIEILLKDKILKYRICIYGENEYF